MPGEGRSLSIGSVKLVEGNGAESAQGEGKGVKDVLGGLEEAARKGWRRRKNALHICQRAQEDPEVAARCLCAPSLSVGDDVAADFRQWDNLWQKLKDVAHATWRVEGGASGTSRPALRELDHRCLRRAARTFKVRTATGVDHLSPSHFTWPFDILLQRLAELLMWLEQAGIWPSQLEEALVHLVPKAAGGRRPVGIIPALVRLWGRARRVDVDGWREKGWAKV